MVGAPKSHGRLVAKLFLVVVGMFGFGFALVPLYRVFCDITGFGGKLGEGPVAYAAQTVDENRLVTVEFVGTVDPGSPWSFRPAVAKMQVHPGELNKTSYLAANLTERRVVGQASYNVAPGKAARYFGKPDCFCFTNQPFAPGEARELPVTFYVDPALPADVNTVTLSYTFFDVSATQ